MKIIRLRGILDSNTYVILNGNEAICIDAGVSYKDCKETLGNSVRIVAVLLTHGHFDHCFYANNFQANLLIALLLKVLLMDIISIL